MHTQVITTTEEIQNVSIAPESSLVLCSRTGHHRPPDAVTKVGKMPLPPSNFTVLSLFYFIQVKKTLGLVFLFFFSRRSLTVSLGLECGGVI